MTAKLRRDEIDSAFPICILFGLQSESRESIAGRTAITENPRTTFTAYRDGLMPLDGAHVVWNRGGHLLTLR